MFSVFESFFRASLEREEKGAQELQKSVFSHFADSCTIVARARAVRMSPGATPEAQGARRSGRAEGTRRGLSARRNPRRGKRVNPLPDVLWYTTIGSGTPPASAPEPPGYRS